MKLAYLNITTWQGTSFNAEHYYGKVDIDGEDERVELERTITDQSEVDYLNEKNTSVLYSRWKVGDTTIRFRTEDEVITEASKLIIEKGITTLIEGKGMYIEPQAVLHSTDFDMDKANRIFRKFVVLDWDKHEAKMEKLSKEWYEITKIKM